MGRDKICLGTDYPFPPGKLELGKRIHSMEYDLSAKEYLLSGSALAWLGLDQSQFIGKPDWDYQKTS